MNPICVQDSHLDKSIPSFEMVIRLVASLVRSCSQHPGRSPVVRIPVTRPTVAAMLWSKRLALSAGQERVRGLRVEKEDDLGYLGAEPSGLDGGVRLRSRGQAHMPRYPFLHQPPSFRRHERSHESMNRRIHESMNAKIGRAAVWVVVVVEVGGVPL